MKPMSVGRTITIEQAQAGDAAAVADLRVVVARDLTARYGTGTWSFSAESEFGVQNEILYASVLVARDEGAIVGALKLATRVPYLGDISFFTPSERPVFLTAMSIHPGYQREGMGRRMLEEARRVACEMRGEVIRLDSYDAAAGAGEFYRKCGFREIHRSDYHGTPLIWFEAWL